MILSRLKSNPYAERRAHRRKGKVESATAVPVSRAPPTHAASDSEMLIALRDAVSSLRKACDDTHPYGRGAGNNVLSGMFCVLYVRHHHRHRRSNR